MNDPIVDEVRRNRDAYSARSNYDLDAMFRDIKAQEKLSGRRFVSFSPNEAAASQPTQPEAQAPAVSDIPGPR